MKLNIEVEFTPAEAHRFVAGELLGLDQKIAKVVYRSWQQQQDRQEQLIDAHCSDSRATQSDSVWRYCDALQEQA